TTTTAAGDGLASPHLATGGGVPDEALLLYNSPAPHLGPLLSELGLEGLVNERALPWLSLRAAP
ncbi:MAG: hypothetical protein ACREC5_05175, partial [Thermoplasmata archaeon]